MKMSKNLLKLLFLATILLLASCKEEETIVEEEEEIISKGDYENGILISGEGGGPNTGSVSFVSNNLVTTENLIYKKVNNEEFGTFLQSVAFNEDEAYVIVDNQSTITQVNRFTFEKLGTITTGLQTPRYMTVVNNKGYVTNWGTENAFVAVVNLDTNLVEETITISNGPERIIAYNGSLYVSHKGGFGSNNIISVININTKTIQEIIVDDKPDEMYISDSNNLIVLCEGNTLFDNEWNVIGNTEGSITTISTANNEIVNEVDFAEGEHPSLLVIHNNNLYYALNGSVYSVSENATSLSSDALFTSTGFLYGFNISEDDKIFMIDASFNDLSTLNVYNLNDKRFIDKMSIAIGASKIYFN